MAQLTNNKYWDSYFKRDPGDGPGSIAARLKRTIKGALGARAQYFSRNYADFVLWEKIYRAYLPVGGKADILEIGSAPGQYLIRLHKAFGWKPFGVDYSEYGAEVNKEVFKSAGVDPENVILADAFGNDFQSAHKGKFDIVFSRGVIEHFTDFTGIIDGHFGVLKPGGLAVISIPNYRGINYLMKRIFDPESLRIHNLEVMRLASFTKLLEEHGNNNGMTKKFCGYYGTSDFSMFVTPHKSLNALYQVADKFQVLLNGIYRTVFGANAPQCSLTSPFLLYIGQKK